ncbi:zinc finger protein rsv1 [Aspergillus udagawae]|uniref:Zinc finger protein rsv1 n=1 Tax=Aspergillus udagawae TaxID=91492 RepID=A0ABQ1B6S1_9EURO|nr:zinc finger protein rsv1 [Aspergillus udagawae]
MTSPRRKRERICPWCSQSFSKEDHLARHVRRHTREKPFSCAICAKSFTRYDSLLRHARSHGVSPQLESQKAANAAGEPIQNETLQIHQLSPESMENSAQDSFPHVSPLLAAQSTSDLVVSSSCQQDPLPVGFYDWPVDWASQPSTWLADTDFDLSAFNASVITSSMPFNDQTPAPVMEPPALVPLPVSGAPTAIPQRHEDTVRRRWFTFVEGIGTGYDTPGGRPDSIHIDDADRDNLAQRLQQRITAAPLPSTDFLWETHIVREKSEALSMVQAALIGQTFGMLSGRPKDLLTVQTFHGTVITWAKRKNFFSGHRAIDLINIEDIERAPERAWTVWSQAEEEIRLWAAISILDAELSELLLSEPLLRRLSSSNLVSEDDLWTAPTAQAWGNAVRRRVEQRGIHISPSSPPSQAIGFRSYVELEGVTSAISDDTNSLENNRRDLLLVKYQPVLMSFYDRYLHPFQQLSFPQGDKDKYCQQALWHANFLSLRADLDRLEQALEREGFDEAQRNTSYARAWANSSNGLRCAIHAVLILRLLETLPAGGTEPAIHSMSPECFSGRLLSGSAI